MKDIISVIISCSEANGHHIEKKHGISWRMFIASNGYI
jgi:hypothetical protein